MSGLEQPPAEPSGSTGVPQAEPWNPMAPQEPPKKSGRALIGVGIAAAAAVVGALLVKFVLPLAIVGVAGEVLGVAFGGPYAQLPGDVRSGFETRLEAALGASFKDLPDDQQSAQIGQLVKAGMPRLDDGLIDANFRLTAKAMGAVDGPSCAGVARAIFAGIEPPEAAATAMVSTLTGADLQQWFEIRIAAIEAEVRGVPDQVSIADADVEPLYQAIFTTMSQADLDTIASMGTGGTVEDAAICSAVRGLYNAVLTLPAGEVLLFARYDITP